MCLGRGLDRELDGRPPVPWQLLCRSSWVKLGVQDSQGPPLPPPFLLTRWRLKSLNL